MSQRCKEKGTKGHLFFASAGKSYVIQVETKYRILAINDLGDGNQLSLVVVKGRLFLVGIKNIYCIGTEHAGKLK